MVEEALVPEEFKRQTRYLVATKTVWWHRGVALFFHDHQILTLMHRTLTHLDTVGLRRQADAVLTIGTLVLVRVFGSWYRAKVERLFWQSSSGPWKYASVTLIDVGRFIEKIRVRDMIDISVLCDTLAYVKPAELHFLDQFHPRQFQISDPDVLNQPKVRACIDNNIWIAESVNNDSGEALNDFADSQVPSIHVLCLGNREYLSDCLEPLLKGTAAPDRTIVSLLADVKLNPIEEVSLVRNDGAHLGVKLTRFPSEELLRLECELTVAAEHNYLTSVQGVKENDIVAVEWNDKFVRGRVLNFGESHAKVHLVDYGVSVTRTIAGLWELPLRLADRLPAYGLRVKIRHEAIEIPPDTTLLVLSSIEYNRETKVAIADVNLLESFSGRAYPVTAPRTFYNGAEEPETDVLGVTITEAQEDAVVPSCDNFSVEQSTDPYAETPEELELVFDDSYVESTEIIQSVQSGTAMEQADEKVTRENIGFENLNGIAPLPNSDEVLPSLEGPEYQLPVVNPQPSGGVPAPLQEDPVVAKSVMPLMETNGELSKYEAIPEECVLGATADEEPPLHPNECVATNPPELLYQVGIEEHSSSSHAQPVVESNYLMHAAPTGTNDPTPCAENLRNAQLHEVSDPWGSHARPGEPASVPPEDHNAEPPQIDAGLLMDELRHPGKHDAMRRRNPKEQHSSNASRLRAEPCPPQAKIDHPDHLEVLPVDGGVDHNDQAVDEDYGPNSLAHPLNFMVEDIVKPHITFIGVDYTRKREIQSMLSQLDRESLEEVPVRRLKIDQVVLLEHMDELVRGKAVEITRLKIHLKLMDSYGARSATKVYACPDAIAEPPSTLQEIQLLTPNRELVVGAYVSINFGRYEKKRLISIKQEFSVS